MYNLQQVSSEVMPKTCNFSHRWEYAAEDAAGYSMVLVFLRLHALLFAMCVLRVRIILHFSEL